jgi:hypothetical protein
MAIFLAALLWILISVPVAIVVGTVIRFGSSGLPRRRLGEPSQAPAELNRLRLVTIAQAPDRLIPRASRAVYRCSAADRSSGVEAGNQPRAALEGDICPEPTRHNGDPVAEADQEALLPWQPTPAQGAPLRPGMRRMSAPEPDAHDQSARYGCRHCREKGLTWQDAPVRSHERSLND